MERREFVRLSKRVSSWNRNNTRPVLTPLMQVTHDDIDIIPVMQAVQEINLTFNSKAQAHNTIPQRRNKH